MYNKRNWQEFKLLYCFCKYDGCLQVSDDNTFPFVISYNKDGRIYHTALVRRRGLGYYSLNSISSGNIVTNNIDQYFHANTLLDFILKNKILFNFNKLII